MSDYPVHKCTSCGFEYEIVNESWSECPNCELPYKHRIYDLPLWIENNILFEEFEKNSIQIKCGHGRAGDYIIPLRQSNPAISYLCCFNCYHMILGDMIERAFTVKMK